MLLSQILWVIAQTTLEIKYKILTCNTSDDAVKVFKSIAWAYRPCIEAFKHLRLVITINVGFLSGRYKGTLLMACGYESEKNIKK
jgi:hypothetical protein